MSFTKLQVLLARIRNATQQRGKKTQLAKFLGVRKSRLSEWLAGTYEPGAETALNLLEWVTAEEAKIKSAPSGVSTTARSKTRSTQSSYEKRRSRPRKTYHQKRSNRKL